MCSHVQCHQAHTLPYHSQTPRQMEETPRALPRFFQKATGVLAEGRVQAAGGPLKPSIPAGGVTARESGLCTHVLKSCVHMAHLCATHMCVGMCMHVVNLDVCVWRYRCTCASEFYVLEIWWPESCLAWVPVPRLQPQQGGQILTFKYPLSSC